MTVATSSNASTSSTTSNSSSPLNKKKKSPRFGNRFRALSSSLSSRSKSASPRHSHCRKSSPPQLQESRQPPPSSIRTAILSSKSVAEKFHENDVDASTIATTTTTTDNQKMVPRAPRLCLGSSSCTLPTAILATMCGYNDLDEDEIQLKYRLPFDPTVEESIECVFCHQLEEGLPLLMLDDSDEEEDELQTSRRRFVRKTSGSLHHVSTIGDRLLEENAREEAPVSKKETNIIANADNVSPTTLSIPSCPCHPGLQKTPTLLPQDWPQRPLLLRPTPGSHTRIRGIRFASSRDYLWSPSQTDLWPQRLSHHSTNENTATSFQHYKMCDECMVLPINNGKEAPGQALVVDFTSRLFEGTLLLRIRDTHGTTSNQDAPGYFDGMNRRYQLCIKGKFLSQVNLTECVTGFALERPCGKMPPKWIVKGALKVVTFFAPQLQVKLDGDKPCSTTPLGSTPQVLSVQEPSADDNEDAPYMADASIQNSQEEPIHKENSILGIGSDAPASLSRARLRKRAFDKLYERGTPVFVEPNLIYTFEFLQHMIDFNDFSVELGSLLGSLPMSEILDGQPLQIMAACRDEKLWSFDVWHEQLVEASLKHDNNEEK